MYCFWILCLLLTVSSANVSQQWNEHNTDGNSFRFASYYTDHVVLQRAPQRAIIWGYASLQNIGETVYVVLKSADGPKAVSFGKVHKGPFNNTAVWNVLLNPVSANSSYTIVARLHRYRPLILNDVLFGDVWLCSGQSNMQFTILQMFGHQGEIVDAKNYNDIRLLNIDRVTSDKPLYDIEKIITPWTPPAETFLKDIKSKSGNWSMDGFSAVCYMFGKYLNQKLGYPIGLIDSTWGGTPIEMWTDQQALNKCGLSMKEVVVIMNDDMKYAEKPPPRKNSIIWNAMIYPLLNMTIKGAIWYQGEANTNYHTEYYNCTFPAMITSWRNHFSRSTGGQVPNDMPFGFVQIGPNSSPKSEYGYPIIRWQQMMNDVRGMPLKNTFMAVAMDLTDLTSPFGQVHIRDKITVAKRLSNAAMNIIYHQGGAINNFPFPTYEFINRKRKELWVEFSYGLAEINVRNINGFEICCSSSYSHCPMNATTNWIPSPIVKFNSTMIKLSWQKCISGNLAAYRYTWRSTACPYYQCAIYSDLSGDPLPTFTKLLKK